MDNSGKPGRGYSEQELIDALRQRTGQPGGVVEVGIGDDAAVLGPLGDGETRQIVTTDLLIEGVHFSRDYMTPADIGYKALAVNLSDIAAMGAEPVAAFGVLGLPPGMARSEVEQLLDGVLASAAPWSVQLAGGDTVSAPQLTIGFTVIGRTLGTPLLRSGAKPGDVIWHSGTLGLSELGFRLLSGGHDCPPEAAQKHCRPEPRVELGRWLQQRGIATACLDLSDSLSKSLLLLAGASGTGIEADFRGYPFHPQLEEWTALLPDAANHTMDQAEFLLGAAEDFELLFTASPEATEELLADAPVAVTRIGRVTGPDEGLVVFHENGNRSQLEETGWQHSL